MLVQKKMKNLFAYNLITILNCGKIKALSKKSFLDNHFYDVSFEELEKLEIENVIKLVGLYPFPFFSLKSAKVSSPQKEVETIRNLWQSVHLSNHIHDTVHALTLTSRIKTPHDLHSDLCLTDEHWPLLNHQTRRDVSTIRNAFIGIGREMPRKDHSSFVLEPGLKVQLLRTNLPHKIVAQLTGMSILEIKKFRSHLIVEKNFIQKTKVQKRELERHTFDRFLLFVAVCYYELQLISHFNPVEAFVRTLKAFEHSPTVLANKSEACHLSLNLYHWLTAHDLLPTHDRAAASLNVSETFPQSLVELFDFKIPKRMPSIKNMGCFHIPDHIDNEHKRLLQSINEAITNNRCLKTVVKQYYAGEFA